MSSNTDESIKRAEMDTDSYRYSTYRCSNGFKYILDSKCEFIFCKMLATEISIEVGRGKQGLLLWKEV